MCVCSVLILSSHMVDLLERLEGGEYFLALFSNRIFSGSQRIGIVREFLIEILNLGPSDWSS